MRYVFFYLLLREINYTYNTLKLTPTTRGQFLVSDRELRDYLDSRTLYFGVVSVSVSFSVSLPHKLNTLRSILARLCRRAPRYSDTKKHITSNKDLSIVKYKTRYELVVRCDTPNLTICIINMFLRKAPTHYCPIPVWRKPPS